MTMSTELFLLLAHIVSVFIIGHTMLVGVPKVEWTNKQAKEYLEYCQTVLSQEYYRIRDIIRDIQTGNEFLPTITHILQAVVGLNIAYFVYDAMFSMQQSIREEFLLFLSGGNSFGLVFCIQTLYQRYKTIKIINTYHAMVRNQEQQEVQKDPPTDGNKQT